MHLWNQFYLLWKIFWLFQFCSYFSDEFSQRIWRAERYIDLEFVSYLDYQLIEFSGRKYRNNFSRNRLKIVRKRLMSNEIIQIWYNWALYLPNAFPILRTIDLQSINTISWSFLIVSGVVTSIGRPELLVSIVLVGHPEI